MKNITPIFLNIFKQQIVNAIYYLTKKIKS